MEPNLVNAIATIASQGLLGALLVIVGVAYYFKDKKNSDLRDRIEQLQEKRLQDVLSWKNEALQITNKINDVVDTLTGLVKK